MIDRILFFFNTKEAFDKQRIAGNIRSNSIVFIKGKTPADRAIWTHGTMYNTNTGLEHSKGFFESYDKLVELYPWPSCGDWAIIIQGQPAWQFGGNLPVTFSKKPGEQYICSCETDGQWIVTDSVYGYEHINLTQYLKRDDINLNEYLRKDEINLDRYYTKEEASDLFVSSGRLDRKQDKLVSGTNIKTINGESVLGSGNINVVKNSDLSEYVKISDVGKYAHTTVINQSGDTLIDTSVFATKNDLNNYIRQDNIKTINNNSLIGSGDIQISTSSDTTVQPEFYNQIEQLQNAVQLLNNKMNNINAPKFVFLTQLQYDELSSYDDNTLYCIILANGLGTFPITLT